MNYSIPQRIVLTYTTYKSEMATACMQNIGFNMDIHNYLCRSQFEFEPKSDRYWTYEKGDFRLKFLSGPIQEQVIVECKVESGWVSYCQFTCPSTLGQFIEIIRAYGLR